MVQYMVNENVDAQILHELKLIDSKNEKKYSYKILWRKDIRFV